MIHFNQVYTVLWRVEIDVDKPSGSTYLLRWISRLDPPSKRLLSAMFFVHRVSQSRFVIQRRINSSTLLCLSSLPTIFKEETSIVVGRLARTKSLFLAFTQRKSWPEKETAFKCWKIFVGGRFEKVKLFTNFFRPPLSGHFGLFCFGLFGLFVTLPKNYNYL